MPIEDDRSSSPAAARLDVEGAGAEAGLPTPDPGNCLSEEQVLAFSEGHSNPAQIELIHTHLDDCTTCLELVNAAVHHWERLPSASGGDRIWMATFGAGQVIGGRYEIERFIGRGGMGEVYLAFDRVLTERVALKMLLSTLSDNAQAIHRLISEARLARRISHPNVCRVHDVGVHEEAGRVDERLHFLTMEFIDGQRLGQLLRAAPLEIPSVIAIARQILAGLGAAHDAGVLHRDLKSDNIMLSGSTAEPRIRVTDFGLSQALDAEVPSQRFGKNERVGSISYMAPEQILGLELSPATDMFAFGVVLFEMLCQKLPFPPNGAARQSASQRLAQQAVPPSQLRPEVGPALDQLVLRCLMEKPEDRCANAEQALAMLDDAVTTHRPSAIFPRMRELRRAGDGREPSGVTELLANPVRIKA